MTFAGCFADTYSMYLSTRFLAAAFGATNVVVSLLMLYEGFDYSDRVLMTTFASSFPFLLSDMWSHLLRLSSVHLASARLSWFLLQVVLLAPTLLLVVAFAITQESPRWFITKRDLHRAGVAMLSAAEVNNFKPFGIDWLMNMLKAEAARSDAMKGLHAGQLRMSRRRPTNVRHLWWASSGATVFSYAILYVLAARAVAMTQLLRLSLVTLIVLACCRSVSATAAASLAPLFAAIFIAAKTTAYLAIVVHAVYVVDAFPTPVRVTALAWVSACGRVGSIAAYPTSGLRDVGREDLSLAITASLLFATLMAFRVLPTIGQHSQKLVSRRLSMTSKASTETVKLVARSTSTSSKPTIDVMKETLEQPLPPSRKSSKSRSSSMSFKSSLSFPSGNAQHRVS
nr:solute carrier family 22 member 13-like [Dermacentor andersoni]